MTADLGLRLQPDPERLTFAHLLVDAARAYGPRTALHFDGSALRYAELEGHARRVARGLLAAGVGKGTRVALWMANRPEWVVSAFAIGFLGGVVVPVNTFATPDERDYILRHSDSAVLLLQRTLLGRNLLDELTASHPEIERGEPGALRATALPHLRRVVCLGQRGGDGGVDGWDRVDTPPASVTDELVSATCAQVAPSDDAFIIYTSGTTARPKGVVHAQRAPAIQSYRFAEIMGLGNTDRVFTAYPLFWTAGIAMSLGATLAAGGTLLLQETFEPAGALDLIEKERATAVHAWPHQEKALAEHPSALSRDLGALRRVEFRSPLAALAGLREDRWGIYASYGASETFTIAAALPADAPAEERARSHGRALPGMQIRIVDPQSGAPVAPGEPGEIAVRGATLMRGYYKVAPELCFDAEGYYRTGDGGSLDPDGTLHWTGRLQNLIKTGGANVSPLEIEGVAVRHADVRLAVAVGVPHPTLGEAVVLCCVPSAGALPDESALRAFLRDKLAAYKVPRRILFFDADAIAYTGTQKVQLEPLREAALRRLGEERAEIEGHSYGSP